MYAHLLIFKTAPHKRAEAESMADLSYSMLKGISGFKGVTYFGNPDTNEYGALYLWENKEVLDTVMEKMMPMMQEAIKAIAIEPPVRQIFEVYAPTS